jgi:hypothetical protein
MSDHEQDSKRTFDLSQLWGIDFRPDPVWEEQKARLWAMTADERVRAMRAGRLSLRLCLHWASRRPHEVPLLNGEFEFIAVQTPEIADADERPSQRERVTESLIRRPDRDPHGGR